MDINDLFKMFGLSPEEMQKMREHQSVDEVISMTAASLSAWAISTGQIPAFLSWLSDHPNVLTFDCGKCNARHSIFKESAPMLKVIDDLLHDKAADYDDAHRTLGCHIEQIEATQKIVSETDDEPVINPESFGMYL